MVINDRPTEGLQGTPRAAAPADVATGSRCPRSVDILVVGGGLAGCATAYYLAKAGAEVLVVERDDINMHASGSNAGSIHAQIPHLPFVEEGDDWARTFAPTIPLLLASIDIWKGLSAELGSDLEVATPGGLLVAETEAADARCRAQGGDRAKPWHDDRAGWSRRSQAARALR